VTTEYWASFGVVQAAGITLVAVSNILTNVLSLIVSSLLLAPGIFITSSLNLGGSVQNLIAAVLLNAAVWHFVVRQRRKKGKA
jgi:hypothetical protein